MRGRTTFEVVSDDQATLTISVEIPDMDESMESMMTSGIQKSIKNIKQLVES